MVRVPGCPQKNFYVTELEEAIAYRDAECAKIGRDPYAEKINSARRTRTRNQTNKTDKDLPVGLSRGTIPAKGDRPDYRIIIGTVRDGGRGNRKTASVDKYGEEEAIRRVLTWREQRLKEDEGR